ncbi:ABC transporter substrate-binding protein [Brevibacterium album]|uniref:ABC transporter substrate-binding protein n=1 Tax=Brevibacterium album TaxID=417948 RepID=UPI0004184D84|nr:ABC transporter substrate-binding protein [Brevibacterium album]
MKRQTARTAIAIAAVTALVGCGQGPAGEETEPPSREGEPSVPLEPEQALDGGDLVMALSQEPDALDPTTARTRAGRMVFESMCEKLYDIDAEGEIVPMLASALPEFSDGDTVLTIPVREDAVFSDGTPLDAEAVEVSLARHLEHDTSARSSDMGPVADVRVVGDHAVEIELDEPFSPLLASLSDRAGMIMSPTALEELGDDFAQNPSCVGPFKFDERVPQTRISVVADPNYYDADQVRLDSIAYVIMPDNNIRSANLRSRDVHVTDTVSPQDFDALTQGEGTEVSPLVLDSLGFQGITVNVGNTDGVGQPAGEVDTLLAQEPEVRRALSLAIDRENLVDVVFNGWYQSACTPMSPISVFADETATDCPPYDPEGAREILEGLGVEMPVTIELTVQNNQDSLRYAQALQASVQEAGFEIDVQPTEWTALLDAQARGDYEAVLVGWGGMVDPHSNMHNYLASGSGNNYSGVSDEALDGDLNAATRTVDHDERVALYASAVERTAELNPMIFTYRLANLGAVHESVAGVWFSPDGILRLSRAAFVDPDAQADEIDVDDLSED